MSLVMTNSQTDSSENAHREYRAEQMELGYVMIELHLGLGAEEERQLFHDLIRWKLGLPNRQKI